ncbi:hypothetical protein Hanom_Chr16g01501921 [Helianthus anomalus]
MLFQRAVERARERKKEMMEILGRIEKKYERDEAKKKKETEKKLQTFAPQEKDLSSESDVQEIQPPTSSTYEVTMEDQTTTTSEAAIKQTPPRNAEEATTGPEAQDKD